MNNYGNNQNNYKAAPSHGRRSIDNEQKFRQYANMPSEKINLYDVVLESMRKKIVERAGCDAISAFARRFHIMDDLEQKDGALSSYELHVGLKQVGLDLNKDDCERLLDMVDKNRNGSVCYTEFLIALRGKINNNRLALIDQAFLQLGPTPHPDGSGKQVVGLAAMSSRYDASYHPDVRSGKKSPQQVLTDFMGMYDENKDGFITIDEFRHYFKNLSASVDTDAQFELIIRNAWHLSGGSGQSQNTSNLRVRVTFMDGSEEVIEIKNDMGLDRTNPKAVKTALAKQGCSRIAKIHLSDGMEC